MCASSLPQAGFLSRSKRGTFVGVRPDGTETTLGTISVTPRLGWNSVAVDPGATGVQVVGVRYDGADDSWANVGEVRVYKKC